MKITFMGAGSTVFARNVLGDCMCTPALQNCEIALYDIDEKRLEDSRIILSAINKNVNEERAVIKTYLGVENRKDALRDATFVVNAIQVGGYEPCTVTDFEIPKKYGLQQTIADTLGIGGIMRGLRTIPVLEGFARDMEEVCPNTLFLNYSNPMAILTGYMQRYTKIKTVGLCHSVQVCSECLLKDLGMEDKLEGRTEHIAGINHMAWLLDIHDKNGVDLYPEIKRRAEEKNTSGEKHHDMVRYEYIRHLGYYCTESSEHNAEYNPWFIKSRYPEMTVMFGQDESFLYSLPVGVNGAIGSTYNFMLKKFKRIWNAYHEGRQEEAEKIQHEACRIIDALLQVRDITAVKYLLGRKGIVCGDCRSPFSPITEAQKQLLDGIGDLD